MCLNVPSPRLLRKFLNFCFFFSFGWPAIGKGPTVTIPQSLLLLTLFLQKFLTS